MEVHRDRKNGKIWLSQQKYVEKILIKFDMKDLGATKQILRMEIHKDMKNGKLWLSQQKYVEKIILV